MYLLLSKGFSDDEDIENDVSILARDPQISRDFGGGPVTERDEMPGAGYLNSKKSWLASLAYPLQELAGQLLVLVENGGDAGITASFLSVSSTGPVTVVRSLTLVGRLTLMEEMSNCRNASSIFRLQRHCSGQATTLLAWSLPYISPLGL